MASINYIETINEAVDNGIRLAGAEDTTENRITILRGIHKELTTDAPLNHIQNQFLLTIENEVKRLEGLND